MALTHRRTRTLALALLAAAVGAAVLIARDRQLPGTLLDRAELLVARADTLRLPAKWADDDTMLLLRWRRGVPGRYPNGYHVCRSKVGTGSETSVRFLGQDVSLEVERKFTPIPKPFGKSFSPDGRYVLDGGWIGNDLCLRVCEYRTTGGSAPISRVSFAGPGDVSRFFSVAWRRDSRRWTALTKERGRWMLRTFAASGGPALARTDVTFATSASLDSLELLGFTESDDPILLRNEAYGWGSSRPVELSVASEARGVVASSVKTMEGAARQGDMDIVRMPAADAGDRIAWLIKRKLEGSPLPALLLRFFPFLGRPPRRTAEIWVSRIDGRDLRKVGWLPITDSEWLGGLGMYLEWSPSGRFLAFRYRDSIYRVPAT